MGDTKAKGGGDRHLDLEASINFGQLGGLRSYIILHIES